MMYRTAPKEKMYGREELNVTSIIETQVRNAMEVPSQDRNTNPKNHTKGSVDSKNNFLGDKDLIIFDGFIAIPATIHC